MFAIEGITVKMKIIWFFIFLLIQPIDLFSTIWLDKSEIIGLIDVLNKDSNSEPLGFKCDIVPIRIRKLAQVSSGSDYQGAMRKNYGFFVALRDIFNLDVVQRKKPEIKKEALSYCMEVFISRMVHTGYSFDKNIIDACFNCLKLPISLISLNEILVLLDILLTPVTVDFEAGIREISIENLSSREKNNKIFDMALANFDLIDRNLLYNYIDPFRVRTECDKKQLAVLELGKLNDMIKNKQVQESFCANVFYTMEALLRVARDLHNKKIDEVLRFIHNSQHNVGIAGIKEYPAQLWCDCDAVTLADRVLFTAKVVDQFLVKFPSHLFTNINYVSWGTGHFLQDSLIIRRLFQVGYKKISVSLIDQFFDPTNIEYPAFMNDIAYLNRFLLFPVYDESHGPVSIMDYKDDTLFCNHENIDKISLNLANPTLLTAVDVSICNRLSNPCFDDFVIRFRNLTCKLYVLIL